MSSDAKQKLRALMKQKRAEFASDPERKRQAEEAIASALTDTFLSGKAGELPDAVFLYDAFGSEVSVEMIAKTLRPLGIQTALPRIEESGEMVFHLFENEAPLIRHRFGMREPSPEAPVIEATEKTLIVVPGLAFDRGGRRLGYGGGFYDRYLAAHPLARCVMAAFSCQEAARVPAEENDIVMPMIITERETVRIHS